MTDPLAAARAAVSSAWNDDVPLATAKALLAIAEELRTANIIAACGNSFGVPETGALAAIKFRYGIHTE